MIRNVIFDCGGVVCEYDAGVILSRFFAPEDRAEASAVIYRDWASLDAGADYGAYAAESVRMMPERLRETTRRFFDTWYRTQPPIESVWVLAARLKARGYGVYLLSNAPTVYADCIADVFPVIRMFDGMVISAPIRMVKPHADIFEYTLDRFGLKAEECVFVDDMEPNIEGARACGLHGWLFRDNADELLEYVLSH